MLKVDPISAKTLPHLDKIYSEGDADSLTEKFSKTPAEPLRRLTLAAIARCESRLAGVATSTASFLLEELIKLNHADREYMIPVLLDEAGISGERMIFTLAVIRYNLLEN